MTLLTVPPYVGSQICDEINFSRIEETVFNLDIDRNFKVDALSDGLLIINYLKNGTVYEKNIDSKNGNRITKQSIVEYIESGRSFLDIDCDGVIQYNTDGMLILRYLFGIDRGHSFTHDAVNYSGKCSNEDLIVKNIRKIIPYKVNAL